MILEKGRFMLSAFSSIFSYVHFMSQFLIQFIYLSTTMIVKLGPAQDLLMQNQNFKRHSSSQGGQRQGQFQRAMKGRAPIASPRAAQLAQGGGCGGDRGGPTRGRGRQRLQHGERRGRRSPVADLRKEIDDNQDELSYINSFDLDDYSSVASFVQHVQNVDDVDGHKGVSPIHEVFFVMRQGQSRYRQNTLMREEDAMREGWLAVRDRLQCVQALYRQNVVGDVRFEIDGATYFYPRKQFESLEHLDKRILELPGNNQDGHIGQEDYVMHASNNGLTVYTREAFVDYEEAQGWLRAVTRLRCVRKMVE
ncbi:protein argonaute 4A-like [Pyrus ussuriensis x Pyrus communis]|uniref:Protein argonaute 4A-like n=1 Tax=Pyrus ussuriensis x Pyrus communis TaxID=2448454 RepID=A0A5N5FRU9_9ROSA|nr:protein argonaute 4A-like [Pyrus ussuriensis x Pyrus communis]